MIDYGDGWWWWMMMDDDLFAYISFLLQEKIFKGSTTKKKTMAILQIKHHNHRGYMWMMDGDR